MLRQQLHQPLADHCRRAQHARAKLPLEELFAHSLFSTRRLLAAPAAPRPLDSSAASPIFIPRNSGRNAFRSQTPIPCAAARGSTLACSTIAPELASASASA